jgi:hypothetical protein
MLVQKLKSCATFRIDKYIQQHLCDMNEGSLVYYGVIGTINVSFPENLEAALVLSTLFQA